MDYTETLDERMKSYSGLIINTYLDRVRLINGDTSMREVVEHSGGVAILPLDENGEVICVRQFRYAMGEHILELPAGKLNIGEEPLHCAMRELSEETGITADEYIDLGKLYPSPGYCKETLYIYLARGLHYGEAHPDENEFLDVEKIPLEELFNMVMRNEIADAKTVIGILKAKATVG